MGTTSYPGGVLSWGVPAAGIPWMRGNGQKHWFVQANYGTDGNPGDTPDAPFLTMDRAFDFIKSGDTIHVTGNIREQLTTPVGIFDVTVIGEGNLPRNCDAHSDESLTDLGGRSSCTWRGPASPAAATPLVKVLQQGWRFYNILFNPPSDAAGILCYRDGGSGDAERDGSHMDVVSCRFVGGQDGIETSGGPAFLRVLDNVFYAQTGKALKATTGAGIGTLLGFRIQRNHFLSGAQHIVAGLSNAVIEENTFSAKSGTYFVDLNGGGANMVTRNKLSGTYSVAGGYRSSGATDDWSGNFNSLSGGVTAANPA